jgi:Family of unknown function (DUF6491)
MLQGLRAMRSRTSEVIVMKRVLAAAVLFAISATAAHADTREYEKAELARYSKYAMDPVPDFTMFTLWQWQVLAPDKLLLWSTIKDVYLVTVHKSCNRLEWANGLSITQAMQWKVTTKFDFIDFGSQHCKIEEIRPIDYKAMRVADGGNSSSR